MSTTNPRSRIARHLTLRGLEFTTVSSTVLAFSLTIMLVSSTPLKESNAVAMKLVETLGWTGAGVLAVAFEAGAFALFERLQGR